MTPFHASHLRAAEIRAFRFVGLTDVNGKFYGTTANGGAHTGCYDGCGTVFALTL